MLLPLQEGQAWVGPTMAVSLVVIAFAFAVIGLVTGVVGWKLLKQMKALQAQLAGVQDDVRRTMRSVRRGAREARDVARLVHGEAEEFADTSHELHAKLRAAANRVQERFNDLDALYEVVYNEVADTALDVAAGVRRFRHNPVVRTVRRILSRG
jgi:uncharacterized protein YoxC